MGQPQKLGVRVTQADRAKDGKAVFVLSLDLDGFKWTVVRREKDVHELHAELTKLMRFVPDMPLAGRRRLWRGAEPLVALQKRLQGYLVELTVNGQWLWDECKVLRHFLQIPIAPVNRQAREAPVKRHSALS